MWNIIVIFCIICGGYAEQDCNCSEWVQSHLKDICNNASFSFQNQLDNTKNTSITNKTMSVYGNTCTIKESSFSEFIKARLSESWQDNAFDCVCHGILGLFAIYFLIKTYDRHQISYRFFLY